MATQVQFRGGTTTEHASFNGAAREVTVDTTKQTLVVQDGSTNGGFPLMREDGQNASDGQRNTRVGDNAGNSFTGTDALDNTLIGYDAGTAITTGDANTFVGSYAGDSTTTGGYNTSVGNEAGGSGTTGNGKVAIGYHALKTATDGSYQIAIGYEAMKSTTTGTANTMIGYRSGHNHTTGVSNTSLGYASLYSLTEGSRNTAIGHNTCSSITDGGHDNTAVGWGALTWVNNGDNNAAFGRGSLIAATTGSKNAACGKGALETLTTGGSNSAIGTQAGYTVTTGSDNSFLGDETAGPTTASYSVVIGRGLNIGNVSNKVAISNGTVNANFSGSDSSWTFTSDGRDKTDIVNLDLGLDFIKKIQPRKFRWDFRDKKRFPVDSATKPEMLIKAGFIAQELEAILAETNATYTGIVNKDDPDNLTVGATGLIPMMINAIKELSAKVTALEAA